MYTVRKGRDGEAGSRLTFAAFRYDMDIFNKLLKRSIATRIEDVPAATMYGVHKAAQLWVDRHAADAVVDWDALVLAMLGKFPQISYEIMDDVVAFAAPDRDPAASPQ